jgi:folylpolyglutamate synthase
MATASRTYTQAIDSLNGLQTNFAVIDAIRKAGTKANDQAIPQMLEWARRAGYEDPKVLNKLNAIHVTGTKGKGSTCAFVQSILEQYRSEAGPVRRIGLYTSPHLISVRERIRIDGEPISEDKFTKYFFEVWDRIESTTSDLEVFPENVQGAKPNYFRYLTLLSFHVFMQEGVDTAIYEVGIGGEYDSTNILVSPSVCGVSALGLDHVHILGDTLEKIAWNKAGIFKPGAPAFTSPQPDGPMQVLKERALEKHTTLEVVPVDERVASTKLGLAGEFQKGNASLAVKMAAAHLQKLGHPVDLEGGLPEKFLKGLANASWPGRCQTIRDGDTVFYLDGAHTHESLLESGKWFATETKVGSASEPRRVLLFNQQTRNASALVDTLHDALSSKGVRVDEACFTTNVTWSSGSYSADLVSYNTSKDDVDRVVVQKALSEEWSKLDPTAERHVYSNIEDALNHIRSLEGHGPIHVFVTGSLLLVGGFLAVLTRKSHA